MITEKRRAKNIENATEWFYSKDKWGYSRSHIFKVFNPEQVHHVIYLFRQYTSAMEVIAGFTRRFKQTADEITIEELQEVANLAVVEEVHDS